MLAASGQYNRDIIFLDSCCVTNYTGQKEVPLWTIFYFKLIPCEIKVTPFVERTAQSYLMVLCDCVFIGSYIS